MPEGNGDKYRSFSATVNPDNLAKLDALVDKGVFRNRSHAIDEAIRCLLVRIEEESHDTATP